MVELCIGIGQEHPEGVLKLLYSELVLGFKYKSDMMAAMCNLNLATIWQEEPVILHILPQEGRQVKEYITVKGDYLSST